MQNLVNHFLLSLYQYTNQYTYVQYVYLLAVLNI